MRFSRKSPAVGSMERHVPEADEIETDEKARVAVSSRGLASVAAEGFEDAAGTGDGHHGWGGGCGSSRCCDDVGGRCGGR